MDGIVEGNDNVKELLLGHFRPQLLQVRESARKDFIRFGPAGIH